MWADPGPKGVPGRGDPARLRARRLREEPNDGALFLKMSRGSTAFQELAIWKTIALLIFIDSAYLFFR
jgi:hypothetical protein